MKVRSILLVVPLLLSSFGARAQFYPDSNATWCIYPGPGFPDIINLVMRAGPDTVIMGHSYQRIYMYWGSDPWTQNWAGGGLGALVRSTADGKGYVFVPDSMAEYLTGDAGVGPGDTVHDVLADNNTQFEPLNRHLWDFIIDSVVAINNDGITITRHYVHEVSFYNSTWVEFNPQYCFWQAGMGTAQGIHLNMDDNFGHSITRCAMTGDSTVLSWYTNPPLMPSAFVCCNSAIAAVEELPLVQDLLFMENPSGGIFHLRTGTTERMAVFDGQGRALFTTRSNEVDLSAYLPGVYVVVIVSGERHAVQRLVVMR